MAYRGDTCGETLNQVENLKDTVEQLKQQIETILINQEKILNLVTPRLKTNVETALKYKFLDKLFFNMYKPHTPEKIHHSKYCMMLTKTILQ